LDCRVVVHNQDFGASLPFLRKRAAQLFSKSRFIAAQFDAYLADDLWLKNAAHANRMAARLAAHIEAASRFRLAWKPAANEVFGILPTDVRDQLEAAGAVFYPWHKPHGYLDPLTDNEMMARFVTSFATTEAEIDRFGEVIR
jgi:threonine aldolase